jgi:hypothetical protein
VIRAGPRLNSQNGRISVFLRQENLSAGPGYFSLIWPNRGADRHPDLVHKYRK